MEPVWAATRKALADYVSEVNYKIWIDPLKPLGFEGGILRLGCPNQFFLAWVREHYLGSIMKTVQMVKGEGYPIETIELCMAPAVKPSKNHDIQPHSQYELPQLDVYRQSPMRFNPRFTFDRFVVGNSNEYAFSAARAMTREMEINTNALLILSDHGLGKSHLSQALGQTVLSENQRKKVYYLTAEDFTNEMVYSLKNRCIEDFKRKYRQACDLLVLEEVHFLSGKDKVQTELSYTLDSLYESNKKVVFTSSRLPKDIPKLGRQLSSRLSNSLISSITPPDYPTRLRIIERKALDLRLKMPDNVMEFMAQHLKKDIRQMESALNSVGVRSQLMKRDLNLELVKETLADLIESHYDGASPQAIRDLICRHYQVSVEELCSKSRRKNVVLPRNLGMYFCRKMTDLPLKEIGRLFGRNHSTVLYAVNLIENRCRRDVKLKGHVEFLSEKMKENLE